MPHIMKVNRLEAKKEPFRREGFDQIRPHSIRSLQFDQKVRPQSFRPNKFDLFTATHARSTFEADLWYLGDENLSDDYRTVLKDLKKQLKRKQQWDSKLNPRNAKFFYLRTSLKNADRQF